MLIAPLLPYATEAELHSVMTSGFSTIAGGVLAAYIALGVSPTHLIAASVISAPAALVLSKVASPSVPQTPLWSQAAEAALPDTTYSAAPCDTAALSGKRALLRQPRTPRSLGEQLGNRYCSNKHTLWHVLRDV